MPHRVEVPIDQPCRARVVRATTRPRAATLLLVIIALTASARARGQAPEAADGFEAADGTAIGVRAAIEPPRQLTVEEAERSLTARRQRVLGEYSESLDAPGQAVEPRDEPPVDDLPPELGVPPQPDDDDGAITLERQERGAGQ